MAGVHRHHEAERLGAARGAQGEQQQRERPGLCRGAGVAAQRTETVQLGGTRDPRRGAVLGLGTVGDRSHPHGRVGVVGEAQAGTGGPVVGQELAPGQCGGMPDVDRGAERTIGGGVVDVAGDRGIDQRGRLGTGPDLVVEGRELREPHQLGVGVHHAVVGPEGDVEARGAVTVHGREPHVRPAAPGQCGEGVGDLRRRVLWADLAGLHRPHLQPLAAGRRAPPPAAGVRRDSRAQPLVAQHPGGGGGGHVHGVVRRGHVHHRPDPRPVLAAGEVVRVVPRQRPVVRAPCMVGNHRLPGGQASAGQGVLVQFCVLHPDNDGAGRAA